MARERVQEGWETTIREAKVGVGVVQYVPSLWESSR
jgi:hypothetical protein